MIFDVHPDQRALPIEEGEYAMARSRLTSGDVFESALVRCTSAYHPQRPLICRTRAGGRCGLPGRAQRGPTLNGCRTSTNRS